MQSDKTENVLPIVYSSALNNNVNIIDYAASDEPQTFILNMYEKSGEKMVETHINKIKEHLDGLGLTYHFELVNINNKQNMNTMTMKDIQQMENDGVEPPSGILNTILSYVGMDSNTASGEQTDIVTDAVFKLPDNYTGVLKVKLTIDSKE